jgi:hypothetical protein
MRSVGVSGGRRDGGDAIQRRHTICPVNGSNVHNGAPSVALFSFALKKYLIPVRFTAMTLFHSLSSNSTTKFLP